MRPEAFNKYPGSLRYRAPRHWGLRSQRADFV